MTNMQTPDLSPVTLSGVKIVYKNFSGEYNSYNTKGSRHFSILLDHDLAEYLAGRGFNIRYPKERTDIDPNDDKRLPTLEVTLSANHDYIFPQVKLYTVMDGIAFPVPVDDFDQIDRLDKTRISDANLVIKPSAWVMDEGKRSERRGIKAYVSVLYLNIDVQAVYDPFAEQYANPVDTAGEESLFDSFNNATK